MELDTPGPTLLLAIVLTFIVLFVQRAKWVRKLREGMQTADSAQFERMPSFGNMLLRFWIRDAKGFGWRQIPHYTAEKTDGSEGADAAVAS